MNKILIPVLDCADLINSGRVRTYLLGGVCVRHGVGCGQGVGDE